MTIINLSEHLDFISWSPTLASVKLLSFEQPDGDLHSLLHKIDERDSLLLSKMFSLSKTKTKFDDSVVLLKKGYYLKTVHNYL